MMSYEAKSPSLLFYFFARPIRDSERVPMRRSLLLRHRPTRIKWNYPFHALPPSSISTSSPILKFESFSRNFSFIHRPQQDLQTDLQGPKSLINRGIIVASPTTEDAADPDLAASEPISSLVLRPYQLACEDKCIEALKTYSRVGISSPTGMFSLIATI